jgi:hypothetical protein
MKTAMERRRFRRADLEVPVSIRTLDQGASAAPVIGQVKDVSLAGLYCYFKDPCPFASGERVACSISVPPEQARSFPFTRLAGKGWVVRREPLQPGRREGESQPGESLVGLAVAFMPDVTALGTVGY